MDRIATKGVPTLMMNSTNMIKRVSSAKKVAEKLKKSVNLVGKVNIYNFDMKTY